MDPKRIIDSDASEAELRLLRAADQDGVSPNRRGAILGVLGIAVPPVFPIPDVTTLQVASHGTATGAALLGAAGKGLLGVIGAGVVGGLSLWGWVELSDPAGLEKPVVLRESKFEVAPPPIEVSPLVAPVDSDLSESTVQRNTVQPQDVSPEPRESRKAEHKAPLSSVDSLRQELLLIEAAKAALEQRDGHTTLRRVAEYRKQFPKGQLRAEATMLRVEGLVATGQRSQAIRLARSVLDASANGPYSGRIRSLLDELNAGDDESP